MAFYCFTFYLFISLYKRQYNNTLDDLQVKWNKYRCRNAKCNFVENLQQVMPLELLHFCPNKTNYRTSHLIDALVLYSVHNMLHDTV
jgi:hypothetical protein